MTGGDEAYITASIVEAPYDQIDFGKMPKKGPTVIEIRRNYKPKESKKQIRHTDPTEHSSKILFVNTNPVVSL